MSKKKQSKTVVFSDTWNVYHALHCSGVEVPLAMTRMLLARMANIYWICFPDGYTAQIIVTCNSDSSLFKAYQGYKV
jgi:hypothetical protein